jgi:aspartyl protease family protein
MKLLAILLCFAGLSLTAQAAEIGIVGLFPGKAVLVVDGSAPKIYAVGSKIDADTKLLAADHETATIETHGKRQILTMGQYVHRAGPSTKLMVTLHADTRGHFRVQGQINGGSSLEMMVDTGASLVAIPASDARRLGINYKNGRLARASTANGIVNAYIVRLDSVKIGDVELNQVDASIQEDGLPYTLLGMSFLNRMEMRRDGDQMTLTKRF